MGSWFSVNQDPEKAREATRLAVCGLFHPVPHPYYDSQLRRMGFAEVGQAIVSPSGKTVRYVEKRI